MESEELGHTWDDAKGDLWLTESRFVSGNDDVAHHRQLAAAAEREAVDSSNHLQECETLAELKSTG